MAQENDQGRMPGFNKRTEGGDDKTPRRGPRFSIYWVYGIVAIVLVGYQIYKGTSSNATITNDLVFRQQMLVNNDVDRLELVRNKDLVRVYIKKDSLFKPIY